MSDAEQTGGLGVQEPDVERPPDQGKKKAGKALQGTSGDASRALARGVRTRLLLWLALVVSLAFNLAYPLYDKWQDAHRTALTILDVASGSLLVSPLVDPGSSNELIELTATWAAQSLLDRSPTGFDNDRLLQITFLKKAYDKAQAEWNGVKGQFSEKALREKVEIGKIQAQAVGAGIIDARVEGQVILTGVLNGEPIQETQPLAVAFTLGRNPDLGRNRRYPLAVRDYRYWPQTPGQAGQSSQ